MTGSRGVVFLGTAAFAVPSLEELARGGETVSLVVTQPDRPKGRGRAPAPSPVKVAAEALHLPVLQPESVNAPEALERLVAVAPEFLVVVAYGQLLSSGVLGCARRGAVNVHPSLLPRHRGPSPVAWTLLEGDPVGGVSTMFLDEGMDSGPVLLQEEVPVGPETTRGELDGELSIRGAALLGRTLRELRADAVAPKPQDEALATFTRLIGPDLRSIDWTTPAEEVRRLVHALSPAPAAVARLRGRTVKVLRAREAPGKGRPGTVLELAPEGPVVACGSGAVLLLEVQPEGRRLMSGAEYARGARLAKGESLEPA